LRADATDLALRLFNGYLRSMPAEEDLPGCLYDPGAVDEEVDCDHESKGEARPVMQPGKESHGKDEISEPEEVCEKPELEDSCREAEQEHETCCEVEAPLEGQ
jgi:hypothetical protein